MVLSNAERQKLHRQRVRAKAEQGVTPDDVRRAIRLLYGVMKADNLEDEDWPGFLADCNKRSGCAYWLEMAPSSPDPEDYPEHLSSADRDLLVKVGAVVQALRVPPES